MKPHIEIVEVGPRDGFQNEPAPIPTARKIALIEALARSGLRRIEATSFVRPDWIPQLADAAQVAAALNFGGPVEYAALVPNLQGYERAVAAGFRTVAVFMSATETHNQKNVNRSRAQSLEGFAPVMAAAKAQGVRVRAYVSTAFHCPYEGRTPAAQALSTAQALLDIGAAEISMGDTIGAADPAQVREYLALWFRELPAPQLAMHFHNTYGMALANVAVALDAGTRVVDASFGGLGGCPYAPGAAGNVATEDVVHMVHAMGFDTGVDIEALCAAAHEAQQTLGRPLPSHRLQVYLAPKQKAVARGGR